MYERRNIVVVKIDSDNELEVRKKLTEIERRRLNDNCIPGGDQMRRLRQGERTNRNGIDQFFWGPGPGFEATRNSAI